MMDVRKMMAELDVSVAARSTGRCAAAATAAQQASVPSAAAPTEPPGPSGRSSTKSNDEIKTITELALEDHASQEEAAEEAEAQRYTLTLSQLLFLWHTHI